MQLILHLHAVDVNPTHAATAINEEDELAMDLPQIWSDWLKVRTEVQRDHRVVEDVFMESPVNYVHLYRRDIKGGIRLDKRSVHTLSVISHRDGQMRHINMTGLKGWAHRLWWRCRKFRADCGGCFHRNTFLWISTLSVILVLWTTGHLPSSSQQIGPITTWLSWGGRQSRSSGEVENNSNLEATQAKCSTNDI